MISINNKYLYVHYPKTGGTFVRQVLKEFCNTKASDLHHYPISRLPEEHGFEYIFATVRNPLDWYGSAWKFLHEFNANGSGFKKDEDNPLAPLQPFYTASFNSFIKAVLDSQAGGFYSQSFFNYIGTHKIDRFLKCETLAFDLAATVQELGLSSSPASVIAKPKWGQRDVQYQWDEKLKREILKREMPIINRFYL